MDSTDGIGIPGTFQTQPLILADDWIWRETPRANLILSKLKDEAALIFQTGSPVFQAAIDLTM